MSFHTAQAVMHFLAGLGALIGTVVGGHLCWGGGVSFFVAAFGLGVLGLVAGAIVGRIYEILAKIMRWLCK